MESFRKQRREIAYIIKCRPDIAGSGAEIRNGQRVPDPAGDRVRALGEKPEHIICKGPIPKPKTEVSQNADSYPPYSVPQPWEHSFFENQTVISTVFPAVCDGVAVLSPKIEPPKRRRWRQDVRISGRMPPDVKALVVAALNDGKLRKALRGVQIKFVECL